MATEYWPFLITANKQLDYRVVLCPDFMQDGGSTFLRRAVDQRGADDYEDKLHFIQIDEQKTGPLSVYFKRTAVRINGAIAEDSFGREIVRTSGIVIRGRIDRTRFTSVAADDVLLALENDFAACVEAFWTSGDRPERKISFCRNAPAVTKASDAVKAPSERPVVQGSSPLSPLRQRSGDHLADKAKNMELSLKVGGVLLAVCFALSAGCAYQYQTLRRQMEISHLQATSERSRLDAIEKRLLVIEERPTRIEPKL